MKDPRKIIISPLITEKAVFVEGKKRTYVFEVDKKANKKEIKSAVEKHFNVKVENVNTLLEKGKIKRTRMVLGKQRDIKKAYVTLKDNQRIEIFEGA